MSEELLDILDENGRVIGSAPRSEIHARGLLHRVVHVVVRDHAGRLLLQKRAASKDTHPGMWDTSVGGHVGSGESIPSSAVRETYEELGIAIESDSLLPLAYHLVDLPNDREWVENFELVHEGPFHPDAAEVESVAWFTTEEVRDLASRGSCTTNFVIQWKLWLEARMAEGSGAAG